MAKAKRARKKVKGQKLKSRSSAKVMKSSIAGGRKPKNWLTALLLSIFLGFLGIDRFYMGYVGTGILKLLITICTIGILGWIWWLIDVILIATKYEFARVRWI